MPDVMHLSRSPHCALVKPAPAASPLLGQRYRETLGLIGRLQRQLLSVVSDELGRRGKGAISNVQALLLFYIGDQVLTVADLRGRLYYLGSNVSYGLKKLIESGYIHHQPSATDRRSVLVRLTRKGAELRELLCDAFDRQADSLGTAANLAAPDLEGLNTTFKKLESFWTDRIRFQL